MDSIVQLAKTKSVHDTLLLIVDCFTRLLILRPDLLSSTAVDFARLFVDLVVRNHGLHVSIVLARDSKLANHL